MQIGYTEKEVSRMYLGKWCEMFEKFKWYHNLVARRGIFGEEKKESILDL